VKPKLFWIPGPWRGKLAVASRPRGGDWLDDEINGWRKAGLDVVVSLLEKDEAAQFELDHEGDVAESKGVRFVFVPDSGPRRACIHTRGAFSIQHDFCRARSGQKRRGALPARDRAFGLIAAGVLLASGMGVDKALAVVSAARGETIPENSHSFNGLNICRPSIWFLRPDRGPFTLLSALRLDPRQQSLH